MAEHTLAVQVPAEDGAIREAFEMLDAQMDAWLSAMRRIDDVLRRGMSATPSTPAAESVEDSAAVLVASSTAQAARTIEPPAPQPPLPTPAPLAVERVEVPSVVPVPPSPTPCAVTPNAPVASQTEAAVPSAAVATRSDDEALLASLDPETAKAIRVMRRLSMSQKSVRQLLEEHQAKPAAQPAANAKKSRWWTGK